MPFSTFDSQFKAIFGDVKSVDLGAIEARLTAEALRKGPPKDIHLEEAKRLFDTETPTPSQRRAAKSINFMAMYSSKEGLGG